MHLVAESAILPWSSEVLFTLHLKGERGGKRLMQYSLKDGKKLTSEEKENNSKWDFYHSRNIKPEVLLKAHDIFQQGAGIYVSTSQRQGCIRTSLCWEHTAATIQQHTDYYHGISLQFPNSLIKTPKVTVVARSSWHPDSKEKIMFLYPHVCKPQTRLYVVTELRLCVWQNASHREKKLMKLYRNKMKFKWIYFNAFNFYPRGYKK